PLRRHPLELRHLHGARLPVEAAGVHEHEQVELRVGVEHHVADRAHRAGDAQLLLDLARERRLRRPALLHPPAGELPLPRPGLAGAARGEQDAAFAVADERRHHQFAPAHVAGWYTRRSRRGGRTNTRARTSPATKPPTWAYQATPGSRPPADANW